MSSGAIAIIQARMSSTRLPGKVLLPLAGRPVIWHIADRVRQCKQVERIVVATSTDPSDDPLADFLQSSGIECFRGSLANVLDRYCTILRETDYRLYVRITGDCPLIEPTFIDSQIEALTKFDGDAVWMNRQSSILEGQGVHSVRSLYAIRERSSSQDDNEHVGSIYLSEHPGEFRIVEMDIPDRYYATDIRLTVDEKQDYKLFSLIYEKLWDGTPVDLIEAVRWVRENPEIAGTNAMVQHSNINRKVSASVARWSTVPKAGLYRWQV